MRTSQHRGHKTILTFLGTEIYEDILKPVKGNERPCVKCGKMPSKKGHDACMKNINSLQHGCCGHGVKIETLMW